MGRTKRLMHACIDAVLACSKKVFPDGKLDSVVAHPLHARNAFNARAKRVYARDLVGLLSTQQQRRGFCFARKMFQRKGNGRLVVMTPDGLVATPLENEDAFRVYFDRRSVGPRSERAVGPR